MPPPCSHSPRVTAKILRPSCFLFLSLLLSTPSPAQDPATKKLVTEANRLHETNSSPDFDLKKATQDKKDSVGAFSDALRDWVESRLPSSKSALGAQSSSLQNRLNDDLKRAKVLPPVGKMDDYGYVNRLEIFQPREFPEALAVVAGITMPCGTYDSFYVYDYSGGPPLRVLQSRSSREHDEGIRAIYFSNRDTSGGRLILTLRTGVQCGSSWNRLSYDLFRLIPGTGAAVPVFSGEHGIWLADGDVLHAQVTSDEFLIEFRDQSINPRFRNRTHLLRYSIGPSAVERIDPVALQPQDFVDEWLTRPWSEMISRSFADNRDDLEKWHDTIARNLVAGNIDVVQPCRDVPDNWKVAVTLNWIGGKKLPNPRPVYFLVHELGKYRFAMAAIGNREPDGCPGKTPPVSANPSLFETDAQKNGSVPVVPF